MVEAGCLHFQRVVTGARFAQCERPVVQGTGLHGKEEEENFVERANLLNRPLQTRMVGGVGGGWELDVPGYPIGRRHEAN